MPSFSRNGVGVFAFLVILLLGQGAAAQRFGRNKIQYENFDWRVLSTPHFEIFFYPEEEALAARAAVIAEDAYLRLSEVFDHKFSSQVPFILYASPNDFQQTNVSPGLIGEGTGGFSEPLRNRMVLPYPGDNQGFIHVINHELVHVFMFDIAWASTKPNRMRRQLFPIPLWFAEGAAEWFSAGWDIQADMWMRDATVHDWVVPLPRIQGGYQVYKEGQAAMRYVSQTYGEEKVVEFFKSVGRTGNVHDSVEQAFGVDLEHFDKEWQRWLKHQYWPLYSEKQEPEDLGDRLTNHAEERNYFYQQPAISRDGRTLAFFSDEGGFPQLYVMDAIDRKILRKLATGYRSNQFLSLHSFDSSLSFSPDSERLAFIAKSGGDEVLYITRVDDGELLEQLVLPTEIARSPAWSPVDDRIIFSGTEGGQTDLYLVDVEAKSVRRLSDDIADEHSPEWYPDGTRIVYSSYPNTTVDIQFEKQEGGILGLAPVDFERYGNVNHVGATYDISTMDLATGVSEILISTAGADTEPVLWDEDTVLFVSDVSGVQNLYEFEIAAGTTRRLTDVLGGVFQPSVSKEHDKLVLSAFSEGGWDIVLNESFEAYASTHDYNMVPETDLVAIRDPEHRHLVREEEQDEADVVGIRLPIDLGRGNVQNVADAAERMIPEVIETERAHAAGGSSRQLEAAQAEAPEAVADSVDTIKDEDLMEGEAEPAFQPRRPIGTVEKYRLRFQLDPVGGGFGGVSYNSGIGVGLANMISLSDLMGNHRMSFLVNFYGSLKYSDLAASYAYQKRRVNLAGGVFHYRNYINSSFTSIGEITDRSQIFSERNYGVFGLASYPMTQFDRVDFELQMFVNEKTFYETLDFINYREAGTDYDRLVQPSFSYVHDSAFYGLHGPVMGSRYVLSFAPALPLLDENVDRATSFVDFRRYFRMFSRQSFALRLVGAQSTGQTARQFVVGGPGTLRGWDIFDFEEHLQDPSDTRYQNLLGNKMVLFNAEYRFPLIDALFLGWPGSFGIGGIGGAVFYDMGGAFGSSFKAFGRSEQGDFRLQGLNADYGFGIRANLGFLPLKFDWAWRTDLDKTEPHVQYNFSIAPEF